MLYNPWLTERATREKCHRHIHFSLTERQVCKVLDYANENIVNIRQHQERRKSKSPISKHMKNVLSRISEVFQSTRNAQV